MIVDRAAAPAASSTREGERRRLDQLAQISVDLLGAETVEQILDRLARGARELTGARLAAVVHGNAGDRFRVGAVSFAEGLAPCRVCAALQGARGGVYEELLQGAQESFCLSDAELRSHPRWWGLPEAHAPLRGLLGARMTDTGQVSGVVLVSDKQQGEFDEVDEAALRHLVALAALAAHHLEAHLEASARAAEAEASVAAVTRADEALREGDRRKDEFLALLGHELRNPLAPLLNATQLLERAGADSALRQEALQIVKRQVWHMVRLIDDLLDVSAIAQGRVRLRKQRVELALLVESAVAAARSVVDARGHRLVVSVPETPLTVHGDPTRLTQVLSNLLNNAAKYTPPGGRISLVAERAGGRAEVHVRDTGVGIAAAARPRLFQMFTRLAHALPGDTGGLGVGLALSRRLVELHDGTLELADSREGQGSDFVVGLPLAEPAPAADGTHAPEFGELPAELQILVVDDNADAARALASLLQLMGPRVEVAADGPAALRAAAARRPDVALLDLGLPGIDGFELARRLRESCPPDELLLIAVTGWMQEDHRRRAREAGIDHHLAKPADPMELRTLLARFWQRRAAARG